MKAKRIQKLREDAHGMMGGGMVHECLDEIQRLTAELEATKAENHGLYEAIKMAQNYQKRLEEMLKSEGIEVPND